MRTALIVLVLCNIGSVVHVVSLYTGGGMIYNWDIKSTSTEVLIRRAGFKPERHRVVTEDGYVLSVTRINTPIRGPPVLLIHGVCGASDGWLKRGRREALAFILADRGFDIWIGDLRGNVFSREHKSMKPTDRRFWDFSFHEMGLYDLPALITEVLAHSRYPKLHFIGYSMGATVFSVMASTSPQYNKHIHTAIMLSPAIFPPGERKNGVFRYFYKRIDDVMAYLARNRVNEILPRNRFIEKITTISCSPPLQDLICLNLLGMMFGDHRSNLNKAKLVHYFSTHLSGTSAKTGHHLVQLYKTGQFKQFDYGTKMNLQHYGQTTPPRYRLDLISVPVVIFYGDGDRFSDEPSIQKLVNSMPNVTYTENIQHYSHLDFWYGNDARTVLYNKIVDMFLRLKM